MNEQENPRDTHFAGFAQALFAELDGVSEIEAFRQEQYQIIARRAYDLVCHTIENTAHIDLDRLSTEEHVLRIPDLAELSKEEKKQ